MKVKSVLCGLVCLCLFSGCGSQPQQMVESSGQETINSSQAETTTTTSTTIVDEKYSSPENAIQFYCD